MTQQEFEKLTGHKIDSKSYEVIERIYNEVSFSKNEFVAEVKCMRSGLDICESSIVLELLRKAEVCEKAYFEEREKNIERAHFLIGKACAYYDTDMYNEAVNMIGNAGVVKYKVANNLPLWENDIKYILECLRAQ